MPPSLARAYVRAVPCSTAWGYSVAVALAPVCSPVLRVMRHTTVLEMGTMAQSLAGIPVSALILSSSCGSSVCEETKCVCVCLCVLSKLKIRDYGKAFNCIKPCTFALSFVKSNGSWFILKFVGYSTYYWAKCTLQPNHNTTNDSGWRIHDDGSNCRFTIQKQFLQALDRQASPFHKRRVIHQPIDLRETWKRKHFPSHYSWLCVGLDMPIFFSHGVLSIA